MVTLGPRSHGLRPRDVVPATLAAPAAVLAGATLTTLSGDSCGGSFALPASGLALAAAGTVLWLAGVPRQARGRIALAIGVAFALLAVAAMHQLFACILGRAGTATAELLQAGGLILLAVAIAADLVGRWRGRSRAAA
jgi:hypothetical protein